MKEKPIIKASCENLANACLEYADSHHCYTDRDLVNASLIFTHFLMDVIYSTNQELTHEQRCKVAKTTGEAIRELIKSACGKDMHQLVKDVK